MGNYIWVVDKFGRRFKDSTNWQPNGHWNQPVPNMKLLVRTRYSSKSYRAHSDENGNIILDEKIGKSSKEQQECLIKLGKKEDDYKKIMLWKYYVQES